MALPSDRKLRRNRTPSPFGSSGLLDDLFKDLEDTFVGAGDGLTGLGNTDIYEQDGKLHYEMELPGLSRDRINVRVKDDQLVVTGEIEQGEDEEETNYLRRARRYGRFRRTLPLPEEIEDPEKLSAHFENGVLEITAELEEALEEGETVDVEIE